MILGASVVVDELVTAVLGRFELERAVTDGEVRLQALGERIQQGPGAALGETRVVNHHVRGQRRHTALAFST